MTLTTVPRQELQHSTLQHSNLSEVLYHGASLEVQQPGADDRPLHRDFGTAAGSTRPGVQKRRPISDRPAGAHELIRPPSDEARSNRASAALTTGVEIEEAAGLRSRPPHHHDESSRFEHRRAMRDVRAKARKQSLDGAAGAPTGSQEEAVAAQLAAAAAAPEPPLFESIPHSKYNTSNRRRLLTPHYQTADDDVAGFSDLAVDPAVQVVDAATAPPLFRPPPSSSLLPFLYFSVRLLCPHKLASRNGRPSHVTRSHQAASAKAFEGAAGASSLSVGERMARERGDLPAHKPLISGNSEIDAIVFGHDLDGSNLDDDAEDALYSGRTPRPTNLARGPDPNPRLTPVRLLAPRRNTCDDCN